LDEGAVTQHHDLPPVQAVPPSWQVHGNTAQRFSAGVAGVTLLLAIVGYFFASEQLTEVRESTAVRLFGEYLRLAVEHPNLSNPDYTEIKSKGQETTFAAYQAFVSELLYGCEAILANFPKDPGWKSTCAGHLRRHLRYLCELEARQLDDYSPEMQSFIRAAVRAGKQRGDAPECEAVAD
jgi:hypothetical protein